MYVVVFRARIKALDDDYHATAERLRELALARFGCLEFQSISQGEDEVTLSYWPDEQSIRAWKAQADHILAQQTGRARWYASYAVQIARIEREYHHPNLQAE